MPAYFVNIKLECQKKGDIIMVHRLISRVVRVARENAETVTVTTNYSQMPKEAEKILFEN